MGDKTLQEWIDFYEKKAHEKFEMEEGGHLFFLPNRGFACFSMDRERGALIVGQLCGCGDFWFDFAMLEAEGQQLPYIYTNTKRNIKAFLRAFKIEVIKDKGDIKLCRDRNGKKVVVIKHCDSHILMFCHTEKI